MDKMALTKTILIGFRFSFIYISFVLDIDMCCLLQCYTTTCLALSYLLQLILISFNSSTAVSEVLILKAKKGQKRVSGESLHLGGLFCVLVCPSQT